jgi:GNAT superfamily N-acetyltransferase
MATTREITAAETRPLRQSVLRPGRTLEELVYPGDDDPGCAHFGAFDDAGRLVGIATVFPDPAPANLRGVMPDTAFTPAGAFRLRGMATLPEVRGAGYGRALMEACFDHARAQGGEYLWCNARVNAAGFYRSIGLEAFGDAFDIDLIGPHYVMGRTV